MADGICGECEQPAYIKGWCRRHYFAQRHALTYVRAVPPTLQQRFWAKVDKTETCWLWTAAKTNGYGTFRGGDGRNTPSHRFAYEQLVGPIPAGLQLDHLCRVRACVNPAHLEPVTNRENTVRGLAPVVNAAIGWSKTHCKNGHPFDEANTSRTKQGYRYCKACHRAWARQRRAERRAG